METEYISHPVLKEVLRKPTLIFALAWAVLTVTAILTLAAWNLLAGR